MMWMVEGRWQLGWPLASGQGMTDAKGYTESSRWGKHRPHLVRRPLRRDTGKRSPRQVDGLELQTPVLPWGTDRGIRGGWRVGPTAQTRREH